MPAHLPLPPEKELIDVRKIARLLRVLVLFGLAVLTSQSSLSQPDKALGESQMATYQIGEIDNVNLDTGNLYLNIPLLSYPQLGHQLRLSFHIFYNDKNWYAYNYPQQDDYNGRPIGITYWTQGDVIGQTGQRASTGVYVARDQHLDFGYQTNVTAEEGSFGVGQFNYVTTVKSDFVRETNGAMHFWSFNQTQQCTKNGDATCPPFANGDPVVFFPASDGSGYFRGTGPDGVTYSIDQQTHLDTITDLAGNSIVTTSTGWKDTVGRLIPGTITGLGTATGAPGVSGISTDPSTAYTSSELFPGASESTSDLCPTGSQASRIWTVPSVGDGNTQSYHLCYTTLNWQTAFHAAAWYPNAPDIGAIQEGSGSGSFLSAIILPNGQSYQFTYDGWGSLNEIVLPTGASVAYVWQTAFPASITGTLANIPLTRALQSRTVNPGNGQSPRTWTYQWFGGGHSIITDPSGNDMERIFNGQLSAPARSIYYYSGCSPNDNIATRTCNATAPALLKQDDLTLSFSASQWGMGSPAGTAVYEQTTPTTVTTTIPSSKGKLTSQVVTTLTPAYASCATYNVPTGEGQTYNGAVTIPDCLSYNAVQNVSVYDFGKPDSGSPGALISSSTTTYKYQTDQAFLDANRFDYINTTQVDNSAEALTQYAYDGAGNQTSITKGSGAETTTVTTAYNSQGMPTSITDGNSNISTLSYDSSGLYAKQVIRPDTSGYHHADNYVYDFNTGKILSHTDENSQQFSYSYADPLTGNMDPLNRIRKVTYPYTSDGTSTAQGYAQINYVDAPGSLSMSTLTAMGSGTSVHSVTQNYDGLGEVLSSSVDSDPFGADVSVTTYDLLGRKQTETGPVRTSSDSANTSTFAYDALGRMTSKKESDGTGESWQYDGSSTIYQDQKNNQWTRTYDASSRLVAVVEPGTLKTQYTYDPVGNLTGVAQTGGPQRSFSYDSLSRLHSANNPETKTVSYSYDLNSNVSSKTNQRGVTTSYTYDPLNRLVSKTYSDVTPSVCFQYDASQNPQAGANQSGRLVSEWTTANKKCPATLPALDFFTSKTILAFDAMGRPLQSQQCIGSGCSIANMKQNTSFDLAGNLTSWSDGRGAMTLRQQWDAAGRVSSVSSDLFGGTSPEIIFSMLGYTPFGSPQNWTIGNYLNFGRSYDSRMRVTGMTVTH